MAPFNTIHHLGITVSDLDRSIAWYGETFGFRLRARTEVPEFNLRFAYIALDGFELELFERSGSQPIPEDERTIMGAFLHQGLPHFAFGTPSADESFDWAKAKGLHILSEPTTNEAMGVRYFFILDPDGVQIEFLERI